MKYQKSLLKIGLIGSMVFMAGCSQEEQIGENETKISASSASIEGSDYQEAVANLEADGFTNITTEKLEDLITGWLTKDGEVDQISVAGDSDFEEDTVFAKDAPIVVTYHTFASDESGDNMAAEDGTGTANDDKESEQPEPLTVANSEDLAKLLKVGDSSDPFVNEFATKYAGRTIKFDGNIVDMNNQGTATTRYDFLIYIGDYSETTAIGPSCQFNDVNVLDLNLTGSNIPDSINAGMNLTITAKVVEFNDTAQLLLLDPVTTEIR